MACEFPIAVRHKLLLTAIHCLLYFYFLHLLSIYTKYLVSKFNFSIFFCAKTLTTSVVDSGSVLSMYTKVKPFNRAASTVECNCVLKIFIALKKTPVTYSIQ